MTMQRVLPTLRTAVQASSRRSLSVASQHGVAFRKASQPAIARTTFISQRGLTQNSGGAAAFKQNKDISYEELKPLTEQPSDDIVIIDVREPDEVMMGSIPSSVNVPLSKFEKALSLDPSDFTKQYGFHKPGKDQKLILFCLGGKRSSSALELAKGKGWKNIRNYPGSYDDWTKRQKHN